MDTSNTDSNVLARASRVRYTSNTRSIERTFDRTPYQRRSTAMSVALAEPVDLTDDLRVDRPARPVLRVVDPLPAPDRTRTRRPGPGVGPTARPRRLRFVAPPPARARSCRPAAPVAVAVAPHRSTTWRLTERGVAVVLVAVAALVAASVAVVALTALRVTGESYQPGHPAPAQVVAQP
jgi:hypothetical protein